MTELKCPVCNKPMKQATYDYDKKDNDDTLYMSIMPCNCVCNFAASKAVWEALADTKKKLDMTADVLRHADWFFDGDYNVYTKDMHNEIRFAIKAIEQIKDKEEK